MFIQKYINLYYNKSITKCVANAIQTSRLFLGQDRKGNRNFVDVYFENTSDVYDSKRINNF
jgi:hypothetical protein